MAADYDTKVYTEVGGAKLVVAYGGEIEVQEGGTLDIQDGATFNVDVLTVTDVVTVGEFDSVTAGSGIPLSSAATAAFRVYADDGVAAITSANEKAILSRFLITMSPGDCTLEGILGQIKYVTGVHCSADYQSGIRGYLELMGGNTVNTGGANANIGAGASAVRALVGVDADTTIAANHYLCGYQAQLSALSGTTITQTGKLVAYGVFADDQVGGATPTETWGYGLYIADDVADTGIGIGDCTTTALNITGTGNARSIMIGAFGQTSNITVSTTNNYQFGCFTRVSATEATSDAELRSGWFRTRVDANMDIGSNPNWGYGITGLESQLKFYGGASDTDVWSWQASALWAQLETDGADSVHFEDGCVAAAVFANVGLTATSAGYTTIQTGAVACGVAINSNTAIDVTATGDFVGLYIYHDNTALKDFERGIFIDTTCADTGIYINACDTAGINVAGDCQTALIIAAQTTAGINIATGQTTGINVAGTCSTAGISMGALSTAGQAMLITWSGVPSETASVDAAIVSVTGTATADDTAGDQLIGYYANLVTSTDEQPDNHFVGFDALVEAKHNIDRILGVRSEIKFNDNAGTVDTGSAAVYAICNVADTVTVSAGPVSAVWAHYNGSAAVTTAETSCFFGDIDESIDIGLDFDVADGKTCTAGIELGNDSTGAYTTGISLSGLFTDGIVFGGTVNDEAIQIGGTYDHGIRFTAMPVAGDNTNSFINIGDYGTAIAIGPTSAHQFGVMHNVTMTGINVGYYYQAYYTKITTSGTTTDSSIAGHALRMQVGSSLGAVYGVQCHTNVTADSSVPGELISVSAYTSVDTGHTLTTGRVAALQAMVANPGGTGTFTGASHVAYVVVAENATVDEALKVFTQSTTTVTDMVHIENDGVCTTMLKLNNDGTAPTGILLEGAMTDGIVISGACGDNGVEITGVCSDSGLQMTGANLNGIVISGTYSSATSRAIKSAITIDDAALTDGYGANEFDLTITGTTAGHCAATSSWVNLSSGTEVNPDHYICAQSNGVYEDAGAQVTNAHIFFGMRMSAILGDADAARLCPFSLNVSGDTVTGIFACNTVANSLGFTAEAGDNTAHKTGCIPFYHDDGGVIGYMNIYSQAAA